jgi:RNA polymerase sigma-70 factor (sigma-E family)
MATFHPPQGVDRDVRINPAATPRRTDRRRQEFERFVAQTTDALLRTAYLIVWDLAEAEDLVQECLLIVARRWPRVRSMDHPPAYARRVLVNLALDGRKRHARHRQELDAPRSALELEADEATARRLDGIDIRGELLQALATLPPRQRAVLVLRYFEDLSEAQAAAVLRCSVGTVKSTASRGLTRLQAAMAPANPRIPKEPTR